MDLDEVLAHHGVKGMKWGVHRSRLSKTSSVTVTQHKKKLKTTGGEGHPAVKEAVTAAKARQKAKKSGTHSLSNEELKTAVERMRLESEFKRLSLDQRSAGKKFAAKLLGDTGKQQTQQAVNTAAAKKVAKVLAAA